MNNQSNKSILDQFCNINNFTNTDNLTNEDKDLLLNTIKPIFNNNNKKQLLEMLVKLKGQHNGKLLKIGRNEKCICESGKKYKFCCGK